MNDFFKTNKLLQKRLSQIKNVIQATLLEFIFTK